jgi:hypothetical protein
MPGEEMVIFTRTFDMLSWLLPATNHRIFYLNIRHILLNSPSILMEIYLVEKICRLFETLDL